MGRGMLHRMSLLNIVSRILHTEQNPLFDAQPNIQEPDPCATKAVSLYADVTLYPRDEGDVPSANCTSSVLPDS